MWKVFRARSPDRDADNDRARVNRIEAAVDDVVAEIERERDGLKTRYAKAQERANALLFKLDNEGDRPALSAVLSEMEAAMRYCEKRTAELELQAAHLRQARGGLAGV